MNIKYFHPTKTGGTSLEKSLGIGKTHHIITYRDIKKKNSFTTIATVRNPYDRALDSYNFFIDAKNKSFEEFLDYLKEYRDKSLQYYSQHLYTHVKDELFVDYIVRLENYDDDVKNLPIELEVFHENKTKNIRKERLTKKEKEIIYKLYKKDFELLGYEK